MKIQTYPTEIERASQDLAATVEELAETRERIREAEIEALNAVMTARTEDGNQEWILSGRLHSRWGLRG